MSARRVRWACPNGCAAVLASTRPPKDATARFCLACSERSGRLVRRLAPALERERAVSEARRKERSAKEREREKAQELARWSVAGVDFREALRFAWSLPTAKEWRSRRGLRSEPPALHLRRSREQIRGCYGRAWPWLHKIQVRTIEGETDARRELQTLLHEIAHILTGKDSAGLYHGAKFYACLARLREDWNGRAPARGWPQTGVRAPEEDEQQGAEEERQEAAEAQLRIHAEGCPCEDCKLARSALAEAGFFEGS